MLYEPLEKERADLQACLAGQRVRHGLEEQERETMGRGNWRYGIQRLQASRMSPRFRAKRVVPALTNSSVVHGYNRNRTDKQWTLEHLSVRHLTTCM